MTQARMTRMAQLDLDSRVWIGDILLNGMVTFIESEELYDPMSYCYKYPTAYR